MLSARRRVLNLMFTRIRCRYSDDGVKEIRKSFGEISGPKSYPLIGTLYKYWPFIGDYDAEALDEIARTNWKKYGGLVREEPGTNLLHIYEPELIEKVFRQKERFPERRSHVAMLHYRNSKPHVYNSGGLLSINGPDWWRLRSTFQKIFSTPQSVKQHIDITDKIVREFVNWTKNSYLSSESDFLKYLNRLYLEVIGAIALGERFQSFTLPEQSPYSRSSKVIEAAFGSNCGIFKLDKGILWRFFNTPLYKKLANSQKYLEDVAMESIMRKANFFEDQSGAYDTSLLKSFLDLPNIDLKDITGMIVDIIMAAIDTTSYATSFVLYHLAKNPESQDKLFNDILTLLPNKDMDITPETLSKAVYLKSCVKESLRLNPVAIGVGRVLQDDLILKGYLIPKGTVIVTQNMVASRLPQYVKDPLRYKPERWIRESDDYENIHPFLSLPFGFGPRACIARRLAEQNMCIALSRIIREFRIKWMGSELGVKTHLINKPNQPVLLSFSPRKN
ncbi:cytochrome P450 302a1, mitochondrial-like [Aricia agestis]|uniref:cytochrome P450 302a1, mitochondrial-like n=1 Tax=Aricia agestis TaxID=91739 RepID=UPI001C201CA3|nr:cytochrome P450 302a1, mitochondrial-like [Aricia agestis]